MMYFIFKGGPVMIPILLGSVFGLAIIFERWLVMRRVYRLDMEAFSKTVYKHLLDKESGEALTICRQNADDPLASMFASVLENRELPRLELEKMLERMGDHAVYKLEQRLGGLMTIIGIEPLLGFLGTITGLIRAFMAWEKAGNDITVSALATGIYEAMITTAAGLMIAIPFYLCYNYFLSRIKCFAHELNDYSEQLLEVIFRGKVV